MNITRTNIDDLNAVIKIQIVKEDYEANVNKVLKDYRKKANIDGFRPGKTPMGLINKMYGTPVLAEEVNKILSSELTKHIVDNKLDILGEPLPNKTEQKAINWEKDQEFEFIFDIALSPEYTLNLSKRDKIVEYKIAVDAKMLENGISMHTRRFGSQEEAETVVEKELIKGTFTELDSEGNILEGGITTAEVVISLDYMKDEEAKNKFVGSKKADKIVFNPSKAFTNTSDLASMLSISNEEALTSNFEYTINEITLFIEAEVNQELFDKAYGEGTISSKEEFENKIREDIAKQLSNDSNYKFLIDAKEKLVKKAKIVLPEEFLKRWITVANDKITKEEVEKDFANYSDEIRWQLIKDNITKDNDIKITEEEVQEQARKQALIQFQQYGMMDVPEEYLSNFATQILQNEEEKRNILSRVSDEKIASYIKNTIKVEEKEISVEKFNKFFKQKNFLIQYKKPRL